VAKSLSFVVPGEPQGKGRARVSMRNGKPHLHTPDKTASYERTVAWLAREAGVRPCEGPVTLAIAAHFLLPQSASKKRQAEMLKLRPTKKPDIDNVAKAVLDGLLSVAYGDDAQVVGLHVSKHWTDRDPCVVIHITREADVV
jgi:Holliday junction resolvase RusA-like endonuclease